MSNILKRLLNGPIEKAGEPNHLNTHSIIVPVLMILYLIIAGMTIIFFNGTGDAGDSILHYLFARYAPVHPELYFDHWAKPLFVLLASPFAQFGFTGIKIFNVIIVGLTIFMTYRTIHAMKMQFAPVVILIMIVIPLYYILTFSGLTEPLYALGISVIIYLCIKDNLFAAAVITSFLPFIRSEGLIFAGVFAFYLLLKRRGTVIPFLLAGSVVYSVAGYFTHHDLLWVFSKIPYNKMSSTYGSGTIFHFADQLYYVLGLPVFILFLAGLLAYSLKIVLFKPFRNENLLVIMGFLSFFVAHSMFWYLGIFNSMGLKRVLIGVIPLIAIIALQGFITLTSLVYGQKQHFTRFIFPGIFILYLVIFPFTSNPAAVHWKKDMTLGPDQSLALKMAGLLDANRRPETRIICAHPWFGEVLNLDWFDPLKRLDMSMQNIALMKSSDILIWDNWFAVVESNITKEYLEENCGLTMIYSLEKEEYGRKVELIAYQKK